MNITELLEENRRRFPDKAAFIDGDRPVSFAAFAAMARSVGGALTARGIRPGDRVLTLMPLSVELYAALCGVWMAGAAAVLFDPSAGREHIAACLRAAGVRAFVGSRKSLLLRLADPAIRAVPLAVNVRRLLKGPAADAIAPVEPGAPALITFTSGSTGTPKAIARSHGFLLSQRDAVVRSMPYAPDDVDLAILPVFTLVNLVEGVTTVLPDDSLRSIDKADAGRLAAQMARHGVTRITASPRLMEKLAARMRETGIRPDRLRTVNIGGGPVFPDILDAVAREVGREAVRIVYGSTEAEPIADIAYTEITPEDRERMQDGGLLVGHVDGALRLKIIAIEQTPPPDAPGLPSGRPGEIVVAGPQVVAGYLAPAHDAATKLREGDAVWHRTGDCGFLDEQGRLWLLGRTAQVMHCKGRAVYPFAVETALRLRYGTRAALIRIGDTVVLAVERCPSSEKIESAYKEIVDKVAFVTEIPMDRRHSSKVDYTALKKLIRLD